MRLPHLSQKVVIAVVFVAAMFISILDVTIVNVALPAIGRSFDVTPTSVSSVSITFLVSLAVFIPASGWLGDRFGGKRILLTAIVVFTVASALCGLAANVTELVLFRVLQGVGGGMLAPVGMAMLYRAYPPEERVRASSILTGPTALAPALGPVLGGLLVTDLSWRWVFYVNVPIGIAALIFGLLFLDSVPESNPGSFDLVGFLLAGVGLGAFMYGISEGPEKSWGSPDVIATIIAGLALLGALVPWELHQSQPLVDLRLFANRLLRAGTAAILLMTAALLGMLYVVTLFYQDGRHMSALAAGLSTFPEAIGVMLGAQLTTRWIYPRLGPRRNATLGCLGMAVFIAIFGFVGADTSLWICRLLLFGMGLSLASVFVPVQAASFATISPQSTGRASTMFNAMRQLGGALGVGIFTSVIVAVGADHVVAGHVVANLDSYHAALWTAAAFAVAAGAAAMRISDSDARATMLASASASEDSPERGPLVAIDV